MSLILIFVAACFLLGVLVGPLVLAGLTRALSEDRGRDLGDWCVGLGLKSVWRPAMTFNAANELTLKRRSYDEKHDEQKITFGGVFSGVERFLFDPNGRLHDFFGTPFGFVDERFGIVFDARDAAVGRELEDAQDAGIYTRRVESKGSLRESVLGVFEVPSGGVGINLPDVWTLVGGSFDAQFVRKIEEYYRKSQAPKESTTALRQLLVPVGTFIAIVLLGMFVAGNGGGGGGGSAAAGSAATNGSDIEIGLLWLLVVPGFLEGYNRRDMAVGGVMAALGLGLAALLFVVFAPPATLIGITLPLGAWMLIGLAAGAVILPVTAAWFGRSLGSFGMLLGKLFITIGLLSYSRPVITQVGESEYALREYDADTWAIEPQFYRFALTRLGIGVDNDRHLWDDNAAHTPGEITEMGKSEPADVATDGGQSGPDGYTATDMIAQNSITSHVPKRPDSDAVYVRTDRTTGKYAEAGQNRRLMKAALDTAKEKHGGGGKPVGDKWIMGATLAAMVGAAIFDYVVFFA